MKILPSRQSLVRFLGDDNFYLWLYYGRGLLGRALAWIFRSRLTVLAEYIRRSNLRPRIIIDVGCGPMFASYPLTSNLGEIEYIGIDIAASSQLKRYKEAMGYVGAKVTDVLRASAEHLPIRDRVSDLSLSLDVLEHLNRPKSAIMEIHRITNYNGLVVVSLPLENLFQRTLRIGFTLKKIMGDPVLKRSNRIPITRTPEYHYAGDVKSYNDMVDILKAYFKSLQTKYTPLGFSRSINVNAVHVFQRVG